MLPIPNTNDKGNPMSNKGKILLLVIAGAVSIPNIAIGAGKKANDSAYGGKTVKSQSSGFCHSPDSQSRKTLNVLDDGSNVYDSVEDCISDGGSLSDTMKAQLRGTEGSVVLDEINAAEENNKKKADANAKFAGINWGLGLAFTKLDTKIVQDVSIENGVININHQTENRAIAMVESHYFFPTKKGTWGHGPFMAIGLIAEDGIDPLSTYGLGYMFGWKKDDGTSWNLGVGAFTDTEVTQLRDGLNDGDKTTVTDPSKLTTKEDETGWLIMFSANF